MNMNKLILYNIILCIFVGIIWGCNTNENNELLLDAALYGDYGYVELLIYQKHADVNFQSKYCGNTALMLASYAGHLDIVKLLVKMGADVNARRYTGETALIMASKNGNDKIVKFLISKGAYPEFRCDGGDELINGTALCWACYNGHDAVVKTLLKAKAGDYLTSRGNPLTLAIIKGHTNVVALLLENGYDPNAVIHNETPLELAINNNHAEIVKILLKNNALVNELTTEQQTAMDLAILKKNNNIISILKQHGAKTSTELKAEKEKKIQHEGTDDDKGND